MKPLVRGAGGTAPPRQGCLAEAAGTQVTAWNEYRSGMLDGKGRESPLKRKRNLADATFSYRMPETLQDTPQHANVRLDPLLSIGAANLEAELVQHRQPRKGIQEPMGPIGTGFGLQPKRDNAGPVAGKVNRAGTTESAPRRIDLRAAVAIDGLQAQGLAIGQGKARGNQVGVGMVTPKDRPGLLQVLLASGMKVGVE